MELKDVFGTSERAAIAFSGGVDSSYLLYEAVRAGADVRAYYVRSAFQPQFEYEEALRLAGMIGAEMTVLNVDVLADGTVCANPPDRCYYCKNHIMGTIIRKAAEDGCSYVCDGTNASDDIDDRPGFRALTELGVRSPLRECGLTKDEIRIRLREAGLPVWNKPAYACLATRIPAGEEITADKLRVTETAETEMFRLGFRDFRVRMRGDRALVQVTSDQYERAVSMRSDIEAAIGSLYSGIDIDSRTR